MKRTIIITCAFAILTSCSAIKHECRLKSIKTIFSDYSMYEGKITGYSHYVLVEDFSKECLDSITMINIAIAYIDTVKTGIPVKSIKFFNSEERFVPGKSQDMKSINKNCLVDIGFDESNKPNDFIFYDSEGEIASWENQWLPKNE